MKIYEERPPCIIGVAVRGKRLAYCVLEPPDFLLGWGVKDFPDRRVTTVEKMLDHIFDFYRPKYLIVEDVMHPTCRLSGQNIRAVRKIENFALSKGVSVQRTLWPKIKGYLGIDQTIKFDVVAHTMADRVLALCGRFSLGSRLIQIQKQMSAARHNPAI